MSDEQTFSSFLSRPYVPTRPLTIAVSAKWFTYPNRFRWIAEKGFALEYTPGPQAFHLLPEHIDPLLNAGVRVRHHGFFPGYEIGDLNPENAERAMRVHFAALNAMRGRGEQVLTFHIGLTKGVRIDSGRVAENLGRLVEYGRDLGITVSLENLKRGQTSHPEIVAEWAQKSGAMITLDIGHAVSNERVQNGELTVHDFIEIFEDRLIEAHLYEKETDRHHAPQDMAVLGPIVDRLLETNCSWWTIELDDFEDILRTRILVIDHLLAQKSRIPVLQDINKYNNFQQIEEPNE